MIVNNPRYPLRVNIGFLLNQPIGNFRDIHFDYAELKLSPELEVTDFHGTARFNRTAQGILVEGDFAARTTASCVRCLIDFQQPLHSTYQELYAFSRDQVTDSGLILPENANIDLGSLTAEYLLIEIPISPLCRADCRGLCPECGMDLNLSTCPHVQTEDGSSRG